MGEFKEILDVDDMFNGILIEEMKIRPSLHYTDIYTGSDEKQWDEIQKNTGIQKSLLKKRWKAMRNEHRKIIAYNHTHSKKVPLHKMAKELKFLRVDLNGASKMDFSDLEKPKTESFCVTQEMLDSCDINGSVTHDTISFQKIMNMKMPTSQLSPLDQTNGKERSNASNEAVPKEIAPNDKKEDTIKSKSDYSASNQTNTGAEVSASNSDANNRCEDTIFAELVAAILKKMNPDEKKRAKKEIMNILL